MPLQTAFPQLEILSKIQPITRTVLRVELTLEAPFRWNDNVHGARSMVSGKRGGVYWTVPEILKRVSTCAGGQLRWIVFVEDQNNEHIYHRRVPVRCHFIFSAKLTINTLS